MREMKCGRINVKAFGGLTLELRHNRHAESGSLLPHVHADYQILISEHFTGRYSYRGASHIGSSGTVVLLHPGEVHTAEGLNDAQPQKPLRSFFVTPEFLWTVQSELMRTRAGELPFFPQPVLDHAITFTHLLRLHETLEQTVSLLEYETIALHAFAALLRNHAHAPSRRRTPRHEHSRVRRVREYLDVHSTEKVSLHDLAKIADLSPFYLCRVFHRLVGLPIQQYQMQVRVDHARHLLLAGARIADAAIDSGFSDQSHFTREFRKWVGVTPGRYVPLASRVRPAKSF